MSNYLIFLLVLAVFQEICITIIMRLYSQKKRKHYFLGKIGQIKISQSLKG